MVADRSTKPETTGQTPKMLMMDQEINLLVCLLDGSPPEEESRDNFGSVWRWYIIKAGSTPSKKWTVRRNFTIEAMWTTDMVKPTKHRERETEGPGVILFHTDQSTQKSDT